MLSKPCYLQPLYREPERQVGLPQPLHEWGWSGISDAITYTSEVDVLVEDITSGLLAFRTNIEVNIISDYSLNTFHVFSSNVKASHTDGKARADSLDPAISNLSIETVSAVPDAESTALDASHIPALASTVVFSERPIPASVEGGLIPPPILLRLRSRLAAEEECYNPTILTVATSWTISWTANRLQPIPRPNPGGGGCPPKIRLPARSIRSVGIIGSFHLRTSNVSSVSDLTSRLR